MKVAISYPPLSETRHATLGQNRQFQWFHNPSFIYPMVPAWAATLLSEAGHEVIWNDCIAMCWSTERFWEYIRAVKPDLVAMETKTPVVKRHWEIVRRLKEELPDTVVALFGDHVTALPAETMEACPVDYVLTGGDYDFLLANLVRHLEEEEPLEPGVWCRQGGQVADTGRFEVGHDLDSLPEIDRELTRWDLYGEHLFIRKPNTYTMAGRDCWYARCTFCSWTTLYPRFRVRGEAKVLDEMEHLIERYGVREVFDDTGTFPVGGWLDRFCRGAIERGFPGQLDISCNARVGSMSPEQYRLMKEAGFRLLKFGLESGNQATLDRLRKGTTVEEIVDSCHLAKAAGLTVHLTTMVGYPWETEADARRTLDLARDLLARGDADMLQATIVVPYPGTPLFEEARETGWLLTEDWDRYDMSSTVLAGPIPADELGRLTQGLYRSFLSPRFIARTLVSIRSLDDLRFVGRAAKAVLGHLKDFALRRND
ncbi:MAG: B12-binding domain-containing radical SAM protein [Actinobacteria bacterium]|nr:B12-binding domain-containing radical SAM protein [Actinomycetota bacterium]MBU1942224.1 B12-binding domain-containing radical SAM protein [Actinomycetota bacterium]MBU2687427.1 B12-binding domain-containing radical SAM protein [Actinomycetota bacterium]